MDHAAGLLNRALATFVESSLPVYLASQCSALMALVKCHGDKSYIEHGGAGAPSTCALEPLAPLVVQVVVLEQRVEKLESQLAALLAVLEDWETVRSKLPLLAAACPIFHLAA